MKSILHCLARDRVGLNEGFCQSYDRFVNLQQRHIPKYSQSFFSSLSIARLRFLKNNLGDEEILLMALILPPIQR